MKELVGLKDDGLSTLFITIVMVDVFLTVDLIHRLLNSIKLLLDNVNKQPDTTVPSIERLVSV